MLHTLTVPRIPLRPLLYAERWFASEEWKFRVSVQPPAKRVFQLKKKSALLVVEQELKMRILILSLFCLAMVSCAATKKIMKNCEKVQDIWVCEE